MRDHVHNAERWRARRLPVRPSASAAPAGEEGLLEFATAASKGGYGLARSPEESTVGKHHQGLEGPTPSPPAPPTRPATGARPSARSASNWYLNSTWPFARHSKVTLADMAERQTSDENAGCGGVGCSGSGATGAVRAAGAE